MSMKPEMDSRRLDLRKLPIAYACRSYGFAVTADFALAKDPLNTPRQFAFRTRLPERCRVRVTPNSGPVRFCGWAAGDAPQRGGIGEAPPAA